ncbi:DNA methyltransferase [Sulfolobus acidocaldarius]|uniref:tRNA (guanine(10)-N(2))-dimethyltransferase n=4 Tax=Sulfolobus acidocaldarius TaxID=2285 RepID=Q4J9A5_SULAC|nr:DNA methyltransferase [Sulfolobus acidocaldarius]AAY80625.1 RNA methylase [Sulfolobus acidocaldarius DSM 639]AGE71217.1 putative RNA methylase [Sulfolobus acidocaldarius N8]AGE73487.1 putative RNA methylase [Sulfolobus acidocaldarius Ron12/I]ALU28525.1 RNA methyltransferase [Sulfolobus acidocaldarius]ALU31234.1 RNA methyltransferase [Sulfolobus acidocaldarius]
MNYAILNLSNIFLALDELRALNGKDISYFYGISLYEGDPYIAKRSALIKVSGKLISVGNDIEKIKGDIKGNCYSVDLHVPSREDKEYAKNVYEELIKSINLSKRCNKLDVIVSEGQIVVGERYAEKDTESIARHSKRPYTRSGSLNVELARLMINLSRSRSNVLDPFVGTGTILIEANWLGLKCIGIDIDEQMIKNTKINLDYFHYECELIHADTNTLPITRSEAIVTDPPYGRSFTPKGLSELYQNFFAEASNVTKNLIFTTDSRFDWRDTLKSYGFKQIKIHTVYEHKSLSRAIYVVRK